VRGLVNTGNSCFVNAVLQALASCPSLYFWLQANVKKKADVTLKGSMLKVLAILNNLDSDLHPDPYTPSLVLHALRAHGWVINSEEQDAHEMLNIIMSTLEEELKAKKSGGKPSHASLLDISNLGVSDDDEEEDEQEGYAASMVPPSPRRNLMRGVSLPPESPSSECLSLPCFRDSVSMSRETSPVSESRGFSRRRHRRSSSGVFSKFGELDTAPLDTSSRPEPSPFTGMLTSKLSNTAAKSSSPVKYTSFNNITLNLPNQVAGYVSLEALLQMFISQESVEGEGRNERFLKQLTFGKLPECLCLHIQRTGFSNGQPYKRHEYVEFPALLVMDKYLYSTQLCKQRSIHKLGGGGGGVRSPLGGVTSGGLYNLRAVIVHSGGIHSGHYVTYRRGGYGSKSERKWFYTSDSLVKQVPFSEVIRSCAYMLFYEKESSN